MNREQEHIDRCRVSVQRLLVDILREQEGIGHIKAYRKMVQNPLWATGCDAFALPLAAGALYTWGVLLTPALGAVLMSFSTIIVAINARLLRIDK